MLNAGITADTTLDLLGLSVVGEVLAWSTNVFVTVVVNVVDSGHVSCVVVMDVVIADQDTVDVMVMTVNVVQDDTIVQDVVVVVSQLL